MALTPTSQFPSITSSYAETLQAIRASCVEGRESQLQKLEALKEKIAFLTANKTTLESDMISLKADIQRKHTDHLAETNLLKNQIKDLRAELADLSRSTLTQEEHITMLTSVLKTYEEYRKRLLAAFQQQFHKMLISNPPCLSAMTRAFRRRDVGEHLTLDEYTNMRACGQYIHPTMHDFLKIKRIYEHIYNYQKELTQQPFWDLRSEPQPLTYAP